MRRAAAVLVGLLILAAPLAADEVRLVKGRPLNGTVRRQGGRVLVNPYGCTLPEMTWGVVDLPAAEVESVGDDGDAGDLLAALDALPEEDVEGRLALLARAPRLRDRKVTERVAAEILRVAPDRAEALDAIGGAERFALVQRGNPVLDLDLRRAAGRLLRLDDAAARREALQGVASQTGWAAGPGDVERLARSLEEPRGARHDVPAALAVGEDLAGARYSIFVPVDHHPLEPLPLVVALHGGVPEEGRDAPVLGTARDAFELFVRGARARRWIVVCPQALAAPWDAPVNRALVEAVLDEVEARYAVDLERVYVVGQDTGAEFALALAGRSASPFAAAGAAGAHDPSAARDVARRGVGVWLFHGEADEVVPVEEAREAAVDLLKAGMDFVYCELPGVGHGLPANAETDLDRYLATRRRPRAKGAWPRSSLLEPPSARVRAVLGDPPQGRIDAKASPEDLARALARGGGWSETAARRLADLGPDAAVPPARALLVDRTADARARSWAAWLLGTLGVEAAMGDLADAVRAETDPWLRRRAARALGRLGDPDAVNDLRFALEDVARAWTQPDPDVGGDAVAFARHLTTCRLLADLVEALGRCRAGPDVAPVVEEAAVVAVLRDPRTIAQRPSYGEDPLDAQAVLAFAVGRTYGAMGAEATLMDLLRASLKRRPTVLAAAEKGYREGRRESGRR